MLNAVAKEFTFHLNPTARIVKLLGNKKKNAEFFVTGLNQSTRNIPLVAAGLLKCGVL